MAHIFGTHPVDNGGIHMAVFRSWNAGLQSVQIFTAIPKFYGDKSSIRPDRVEKFRDALATTGMKPEHVMVHAAYVLSVATADPEMWSRAAAGLAKQKWPEEVLAVSDFPRTPTGKIKKAVLRQELATRERLLSS